jgi:DNA invertase Pin-like site-specific DNA recombinase
MNNQITVLYIRVSSESQNTERQILELESWAKKTGSVNTKTIIEKISGSVSTKDRRFNEVFNDANINRVVVHDIDRLGRDTIDILQTIKRLTDAGINLTVTSLGMDTILPNGKVNESFKIVLSVMATLAEMERTKLKERQRQGIAIAKKDGKYKGRAKGAIKSDEVFLNENKAVIKQLKNNVSIRNTAKICKVSVGTVQKVKAMM